MPFLLMSLRIALIFWMLFRLAGNSPPSYAYALIPPSTDVLHVFSFSHSPEAKDNVYRAPTVQMPEAVITPASSFQFGVTASLGFLLLTFFFFRERIRIPAGVFLRVHSYFRNLFSTLILINAP